MTAPKKQIIACESIQPELTAILRETGAEADVVYLPQDLHRHPENIPAAIKQAIQDAANSDYDEIVLGYGLCSNAVVGIVAPRSRVIIPRVHDCIGMYLGSLEQYRKRFAECPGTYYLTTGWINLGKDPLTIMQEIYTPRVGPNEAETAMREELAHYSKIAFIESEWAPDLERCRQKARENAAYFNLDYEEVKGDSSLLRKIVTGPYEEPEFVIVESGCPVPQRPFLS